MKQKFLENQKTRISIENTNKLPEKQIIKKIRNTLL